MAERVYKYDVPVDDEPHEVGYFPVHVACQSDDYETVQVWALVDPDDQRKLLVQVFGTGQPVPRGASYIGTALAASGALVWHLFDVSQVEVNG